MAFLAGLAVAYFYNPFLGSILTVVGLAGILHLLVQQYSSERNANILSGITNIIYALIVAWLLATVWMPLGVNKSNLTNFLFIVILAGGLIGFFYIIIYFYESCLLYTSPSPRDATLSRMPSSA